MRTKMRLLRRDAHYYARNMKKCYLLKLGLILFAFSNPVIGQERNSHVGWHKLFNDSLQGTRSDEALQYLKETLKKAHTTVIVGLIDSGIDTTVTDLRPALWNNPKEIADGKDNDKNGYADDLHGWNFLGTKDGTFNMVNAGTEEYREFKRLYPKYKDMDSTQVEDKEEYAYYLKMRRKANIDSYLKFVGYTGIKDDAYQYIDSVLTAMPGMQKDTLTINGLIHVPIDEAHWNKACETLFVDLYQTPKDALWNQLKQKHEQEFGLMKKRIYGIAHDQDKRLLMGDDMNDPEDRFYGNATLMAENALHGTFNAGVIAGQGIGYAPAKGVFPDAKIMVIRAVPNGDEYDKDIASAIRYAADNGARVINMSFGKYTSTHADMVNEAIAHAAKKDVLIVQAAGNDHLDIDSITCFPTGKDTAGRPFPNIIKVGASDKSGNCCPFSNYGQHEVDVFAPGEDITSVCPGGKYAASQGTSVAAPIVTGIATMIRAYFPRLKAEQAKEILTKSARPMKMSGISASGGIVDAMGAVKLAKKYNQ